MAIKTMLLVIAFTLGLAAAPSRAAQVEMPLSKYVVVMKIPYGISPGEFDTTGMLTRGSGGIPTSSWSIGNDGSVWILPWLRPKILLRFVRSASGEMTTETITLPKWAERVFAHGDDLYFVGRGLGPDASVPVWVMRGDSVLAEGDIYGRNTQVFGRVGRFTAAGGKVYVEGDFRSLRLGDETNVLRAVCNTDDCIQGLPTADGSVIMQDTKVIRRNGTALATIPPEREEYLRSVLPDGGFVTESWGEHNVGPRCSVRFRFYDAAGALTETITLSCDQDMYLAGGMLIVGNTLYWMSATATGLEIRRYE